MTQDYAQPSNESSHATTNAFEQRERTKLLAKLLASYPARGDAELTLEAYDEDTRDIPLPWLRAGITSFRDEADRVFLPAISEVRTACARAVSRARDQALGRPPGNVVAQVPFDVGAVLRFARQHAPLGLAQLERVCLERARARAIESGNVAAQREAESRLTERAAGLRRPEWIKVAEGVSR